MQLSRLLLLCLAPACHRGGSPSVGPSPAGETGSVDVDRYLPWSVQLVGQTWQRIDTDLGVIPAANGHPGTLFVNSSSAPEPYPQTFSEYPRMFVVSGLQAPGRHAVADVADGGVGFLESFYPAGDTDGDGHADAWASNQRLYRGPFLGRNLTHANADARLLDTTWWPVLGDFDADQDGSLDVIITPGWQIAAIVHGPFDGDRVLTEEDATYFGLGEPEACPGGLGHHVTRLPKLYGSTLDGVGVGWDDGLCVRDVYVYPLQGPRGRRFGLADATHTFSSSSGSSFWFQSVGDLDGNGALDVLLGGKPGFSSLYGGPLPPEVYDGITGQLWDPEAVAFAGGGGDVNGDGVEDLVSFMYETELEAAWWGLLLSPHDFTRHPREVALRLGGGSSAFSEYNFPSLGQRFADLDGDGLADLIAADPGPLQEGIVTVWYAKDLLGAAGLGRTP